MRTWIRPWVEIFNDVCQTVASYIYENLGFFAKVIKIEPWLGPNIEEMKTELHKRSVYLAQNDLERGGYRQKRPRNRWPPGIPYYA